MVPRIARLSLLALALGAAEVAAQAPVTLRVQLRQGQTMRYRSDIETWIGVANAAIDTTQPARVLTLFITRTVSAVSHDTAIIRDVVDSALVTAPGIRGADTTALRRATASLRGLVTLTAVDGRGRLLDYAAGTTRTDPVDPALQAVLPMGGLLRSVFVLPANPVRPGETWSDRVSGGDGLDALNISARYTLERTMQLNNHNVAVINAAGEMGGGGPGGSLSGRFDGRIEYDMDDSQPTRFEITIHGTVASRSGNLPMRVKRTMQRL